MSSAAIYALPKISYAAPLKSLTAGLKQGSSRGACQGQSCPLHISVVLSALLNNYVQNRGFELQRGALDIKIKASIIKPVARVNRLPIFTSRVCGKNI